MGRDFVIYFPLKHVLFIREANRVSTEQKPGNLISTKLNSLFKNSNFILTTKESDFSLPSKFINVIANYIPVKLHMNTMSDIAIMSNVSSKMAVPH